MTLVERHTVLGAFLCRGGALDEMAILGWLWGRGGRERAEGEEEICGDDDGTRRLSVLKDARYIILSVLNNKSGSIIFIKAVQSASAQGHQT